MKKSVTRKISKKPVSKNPAIKVLSGKEKRPLGTIALYSKT